MKKKLGLCLYFILFSLEMGYSQSAEKVWELLSQKNFAEGVELGEEALKNDPDNFEIHSAVGRMKTEQGNFQEAIIHLQKALNHEHPSIIAWSYGYLGKCYYFTDQYLKSKDSYRKAIELNATKNATNFAKRSLKEFQMNGIYDSWNMKETEHFRFHHKNGISNFDIESFASDREKAYKEINNFFGAKPQKKIDFYVWKNNEDAKKVLGRDLGFALSGEYIVNSLSNQTRGHEIAHILSHHGAETRISKKLINEGVAVFFDQTNRKRIEEAKAILNGADVKILDLWNDEMAYPTAYYYSIGGAWIEYLLKNGSKDQLMKLLQEQTPEAARKIYTNFDELVAGFEQTFKG